MVSIYSLVVAMLFQIQKCYYNRENNLQNVCHMMCKLLTLNVQFVRMTQVGQPANGMVASINFMLVVLILGVMYHPAKIWESALLYKMQFQQAPMKVKEFINKSGMGPKTLLMLA
ncbi:uncharacterized protein PGTG_14969 [Puccinia graminis f. sp. tritici CRL 75-36-700-3]|uniref:Uncharacterized protein n=1 Tax=Puccinia graminis f. sp. tritici (strain CRL 75-36-700-3 / race SCCL) TaxID=418459 RepID=E3KXR6_PUCGT|nr:uncharacterized protein PGTG_14969 [Puccinia graminis f. sp. tritici CRL 75-36-700-3]EFP89128.1 hypothetical protein PGTG_14969 [Puccinia graminis f. sp. tritici CRL 75-36-700-3]